MRHIYQLNSDRTKPDSTEFYERFVTNTLLENAYGHDKSPKYHAFLRNNASEKQKEGLAFHERQAVDVIIK